MLEAKTKLSQLVEAAERGEQVFLKRNGVLVAEITAIKKKKLPFGLMRDQGGDIADSLLFDTAEEDGNEFTKL